MKICPPKEDREEKYGAKWQEGTGIVNLESPHGNSIKKQIFEPGMNL